jgi:hypothetical protein
LLSDFEEIKSELSERDVFNLGTRYIDMHVTLYLNHEIYVEAFPEYDRGVRCLFEDKPAERFLEFDIFAGSGWQKLCAFVHRDTPTAPFSSESRRRPHFTDETGDHAFRG